MVVRRTDGEQGRGAQLRPLGCHALTRRLVTLGWVLALVGCGTSEPHSRLDAIEPASVSALVETPAEVLGLELDAMAQLDLDSTAATIDRRWRVRIGATMVSTTWRDREHLDILVPRGLDIGVYDVVALAPDGRELVLPAGLTVTADPIDLGLAISTDPFGDGTPFGFVAGYRDQIYLGPSATGTSALRFASAGAVPEQLSFTFARDTTSHKAANKSTAPFTSIGRTGCAHDTAACGPDNEDLRGLFTSVEISGTQWMIVTGAKASSNDANYLYMTTDADAQLDFRYVDLQGMLSDEQSYGISALGAAGARLYIGLTGGSADRSKVFALTTTPPAPGLDATSSDLVDMHLERLIGWAGSSDPASVDTIASTGDLVYVANPNAWVRADVASPSPVPSPCLPPLCTPDWVTITPSAAAYAARASRVTPKTGELEPRDRAVPQIVTFGDRIYVARNTTAGPQLWSCRPTSSACDSGDWALVAPNSTGDALLTQFDDPSLTSVTMLVATPSFLYVGFDSANGLRILRTGDPAAATRADFEGAAGCPASDHPSTCDGYGGNGLGTPTLTRIFDAKAITAGGTTSVWLTIGDGTSPLSLVVLP